MGQTQIRGCNSREDSTELSRLLFHGPPRLISAQRWNPRYPCIVASPQLVQESWGANQVHTFIEYLIDKYQINTRRIYVTGVSLGGGGAWYYVGSLGDRSYAAAIVPICGSGIPALYENLKSTPIWGFHGAEDKVVPAFDSNGTIPMVNGVNNSGPRVVARATIYPNIGHDSWTRTYDGTGMGTGSFGYNKFEMSIFDWMFQYKKD